ncbi:hypothetical protein PR048_028432 [Dryococelus australis]|uniref:Uncharacterized protein n=1 Tax=Dryococelus australis TaxID=614101 RepID=A0ABQ9GD70_9NEOP|nr:hypothetical protein PR048_028432 [Dryococelus australis]
MSQDSVWGMIIDTGLNISSPLCSASDVGTRQLTPAQASSSWANHYDVQGTGNRKVSRQKCLSPKTSTLQPWLVSRQTKTRTLNKIIRGFNLGEAVLLKSHPLSKTSSHFSAELADKWDGPHRIVGCQDNIYWMENLRGRIMKMRLFLGPIPDHEDETTTAIISWQMEEDDPVPTMTAPEKEPRPTRKPEGRTPDTDRELRYSRPQTVDFTTSQGAVSVRVNSCAFVGRSRGKEEFLCCGQRTNDRQLREQGYWPGAENVFRATQWLTTKPTATEDHPLPEGLQPLQPPLPSTRVVNGHLRLQHVVLTSLPQYLPSFVQPGIAAGHPSETTGEEEEGLLPREQHVKCHFIIESPDFVPTHKLTQPTLTSLDSGFLLFEGHQRLLYTGPWNSLYYTSSNLITPVEVRNCTSPIASIPMPRGGVPNFIRDVDAMEGCGGAAPSLSPWVEADDRFPTSAQGSAAVMSLSARVLRSCGDSYNFLLCYRLCELACRTVRKACDPQPVRNVQNPADNKLRFTHLELGLHFLSPHQGLPPSHKDEVGSQP